MDHWTRSLVPDGFRWISEETGTGVLVQVKENRWTAAIIVPLASGEREETRFFVEDGYHASLEKCLLYVWRAFSTMDKSTFDLGEALGDLRRYAR
jgi:hypothetical protein